MSPVAGPVAEHEARDHLGALDAVGGEHTATGLGRQAVEQQVGGGAAP